MATKPVVNRRDYQEWLRFCELIQSSTSVNLGESKPEQEARKKTALKDYNYFVKTYFPVYTDSGKTDCGQFQIKAANQILKDPKCFGILEWPREHAKSVHANILIPMWLIAHGQLTGMILMGKNEDDACNLLADIQAQLQHNDLFAHDFGKQYNQGDWQSGSFTTTGGIRFLAIGRDQSPRGARKGEKRPNYAVCDDVDDDEIVNNQKRVKKVVKRILKALYGALSIKGARLIIAGNRIHPQSILAHLVGDIKPGAPKRPGIYHSRICATDGGYLTGRLAWPERYTMADLADKFAIMGRMEAMGEYYHEHHVEGSIFLDKYFVFAKMPKPQLMRVIVGYFDPSFENKATSDFKAIRVWGLNDTKAWCMGSFVRRAELTTAFRWMIQFEKSLPAATAVIWYVEKQFFNRPVRDALKEVCAQYKHDLRVITDERQKENKYTRIVRMQPKYELGGIYYDEQLMHDPDTIEGNNQLRGIEPGYSSPDDSPDADEGAWHYLFMHLPTRTFTPEIGGGRTYAY